MSEEINELLKKFASQEKQWKLGASNQTKQEMVDMLLQARDKIAAFKMKAVA